VNDPIGLLFGIALFAGGFAVGLFYFFGPERESLKKVPNRNAFLLLLSIFLPGFFFALAIAALCEAFAARQEEEEPAKGRRLRTIEEVETIAHEIERTGKAPGHEPMAAARAAADHQD
jgi:hypothetical protein